MAGVIQLTLERDGHDQPWGFRLQGGHDVGMPLSIQRLLVGTPSEGVLRRGDIIQRVGQTDTRGLSHRHVADLFTNAGNQIEIVIKRQGLNSITNSNPTSPQPLPGMTTPSPTRSPDAINFNVPSGWQTPNAHPTPLTSPLSLTIQNQPYRTSPLIQPTAKVDLGPGSVQHLKIQHDYITGAKETYLNSRQEYAMKQKVTGTLQNIHNNPGAPTANDVASGSGSAIPHAMSSPQMKLPTRQCYNSPIQLYSSENVAEVARLNKMGLSGAPTLLPCGPSSPTGLVNPTQSRNREDFDPKQSATWRALQDSGQQASPEAIQATYPQLKQHTPIYAEVYEAPTDAYSSEQQPSPIQVPLPKQQHFPSHQPKQQGGRSPTTHKAPPRPHASRLGPGTNRETSSDPQQSAVLMALEAENARPGSSSSFHRERDVVPLYETSSISGKKRIPQSATFNRLMMEVLGV